jgi:Tol biopolymer transport system component
MLSPGEKLGRYEVVSPLGAGGMGEVYRARDGELAREVALKILPEALSSDPDRVKRFEREAKATAALSHPNVLTVFDVGHEAGRTYLVFEMLEGSTLGEAMRGGAVRTREALDYAGQIARGLAAAHARGIVHRDLKPANLFLTTTGVVKILDFGLARIGAVGFQSAEETTAEVTGPGLVLGTVSYMSPEQARGEAPDARSDLFSLGTVLYEMLCGRHPFRRNSSAETATAILRDAPADLGRLEGQAAGAVKRLVGRCLEKRPEDRFQTANDLALALDVLRSGEDWARPAIAAGPITETRATAHREPTKAAPRPYRGIGFGILTVALVLSVVAWQLRRGREAPLPPPRLVPLTSTPGFEQSPSFSPDGEQVAFQWGGEKSDNTDIYVKMVGSSEVRRLTTDPARDTEPSWSPDGRQIAFLRSLPGGAPAIHLISPLGGSDRKLSDLGAASARLSWSPDGQWLATGFPALLPAGVPSKVRGIRLISVPGGETVTVTSPSAPAHHTNPTFSPDGRSLAYLSCVGSFVCHLDVVALGPDHVPSGAPRRVTRKPFVMSPGLAWALDGKSIVYSAGRPVRLWRVGIAGDQAPEVIEVAGYRVWQPTVAASRGRLAFTRGLGDQDVYRFEQGRPPEAVASSTFADVNPQFSPDGRQFAFESMVSGEGVRIWLAAADGSNPTQLTRGPEPWQSSPRWSPDGRRIAFDSLAEDGHWNIWTIDVDGGALRPLTSDPADENMPSWSHDGRFVYFSSNRTGSFSVWRIPAAGGPEERLTETGGPAFEGIDGRTLFFTRDFVKPSPLLSVSLGGGPERTVVDCVWGFAVGAAGIYHVDCPPGSPGPDRFPDVPVYLRDLSTGRDRLLGTLENWLPGFTVSPDGKTLLYTRLVHEGNDLMLIENFR